MTTAVLRSFLLLGLLGGAATAVHAADEPDLIFKRSTVFKWVSPNDKLATYGLDDPLVDGVACHFTVPEKGGFKGWVGLAEDVSDISLACRQVGPIRFKEKFEQGDDMFRKRRSLFFKKMQIVRGCDTKRNVLVYMVYSDKIIAEELDLVGADHAMGQQRPDSALCRFCRITASQRQFASFNPATNDASRSIRITRTKLFVLSSGRFCGEASMKSDRDLALSAAEQAFMDSVEHLFRILQSALTGSAANPAQATANFEAGLNLAKKARATALASISKIFP